MTDKPYWQVRRDMKLGQKTKTEATGQLEGQESAQKAKPGIRAKKAAPPPNRPKSPKKKIKARSKKRAKQERQYRPVRRKFLEAHPVCEAQLENCEGKSSEIHHSGGRENGRLLKVEDFKALCGSCHRKITEKSREAIAAGHSKTRLGKPDRQTGSK